MRELVSRQLANQHASRAVQPGGGGRVLAWDVVDADLRISRGRDSRRVIVVLKTERDAMHRAAVTAASNFGLCVTRLFHRLIPGQRNECVELRVEAFNSHQQRLGEFYRRQLPGFDQSGGLRDREKAVVFFHALFSLNEYSVGSVW